MNRLQAGGYPFGWGLECTGSNTGNSTSICPVPPHQPPNCPPNLGCHMLALHVALRLHLFQFKKCKSQHPLKIFPLLVSSKDLQVTKQDLKQRTKKKMWESFFPLFVTYMA